MPILRLEDDPVDEVSPRTKGNFDSEMEETTERCENAHLLSLELQRLSARNVPEIPDEPAPRDKPYRTPKKIPYRLLMPPPQTQLGRMLNSSLGRALTFALTIFTFSGTSVGLCIWSAPEYKLKRLTYPILGVTVILFCTLYTLLPMLAKKAGMAPSEAGVDWKPYFFLYRISYLTAFPALALLSFGYGSKASFGQPDGVAGEMLVQDLTPGTLNYFDAADGFVALNLTKGITHTLGRMEHGDAVSLRSSHFRDAKLRINTEPYSDIPEPTIPPGALKLYRIAPVFSEWDICLTRYQISIACLKKNSLVGWAVAETKSICSTLGMVACKPPRPVLDPVYKCSTEAVHGKDTVGPISGICGRVVETPESKAIDELSALLLSDGWPSFFVPNSSHVWLDVNSDECIAQPADCLQQWNTLGLIGILLAVVTVLCILVPAGLDCIVDRRIRESRKFFEQSKKHSSNPRMVG